MSARTLEVARTYVGVREVGHNRGPHVTRWLAEAGAKPGDPWCAAFVNHVVGEAGHRCDVRYPASCRSWVAWAIDHRAIVDKPRRGDLVVYDWDGDGPDDHIGVVSRLVSFGALVSLTAVEGNTRGKGGRLDGVYEMKRTIRRSRLVFIRPSP